MQDAYFKMCVVWTLLLVLSMSLPPLDFLYPSQSFPLHSQSLRKSLFSVAATSTITCYLQATFFYSSATDLSRMYWIFHKVECVVVSIKVSKSKHDVKHTKPLVIFFAIAFADIFYVWTLNGNRTYCRTMIYCGFPPSNDVRCCDGFCWRFGYDG